LTCSNKAAAVAVNNKDRSPFRTTPGWPQAANRSGKETCYRRKENCDSELRSQRRDCEAVKGENARQSDRDANAPECGKADTIFRRQRDSRMVA
jgi:hypothetical protein